MSRIEKVQALREKYAVGIVQVDSGLEEYNGFLQNIIADTNFEDLILELLAKKPIIRVMDVGCGSGKFLADLKSKFSEKIHVIGLDLIQPTEKLDEKLMGDAALLDFPTNIDLIVSFKSLHEVGELEKVFHKISNALALNGFAILSIRLQKAHENFVAFEGLIEQKDIDFLQALEKKQSFENCKIFTHLVRASWNKTKSYVVGASILMEKKN